MLWDKKTKVWCIWINGHARCLPASSPVRRLKHRRHWSDMFWDLPQSRWCLERSRLSLIFSLLWIGNLELDLDQLFFFQRPTHSENDFIQEQKARDESGRGRTGPYFRFLPIVIHALRDRWRRGNVRQGGVDVTLARDGGGSSGEIPARTRTQRKAFFMTLNSPWWGFFSKSTPACALLLNFHPLLWW